MQYGWLTVIPPVLAITLALVTKRVVLSLLVGVLSGAFILSGYDPVGSLVLAAQIFWSKITDTWNLSILVFLVSLGVIVYLVTMAGGAAAYGDWAAKKIRSRSGAQLATLLLGIIIFIDDYFNSLTIGTIMRPVTDKFRVSRAKLAYILDSTAAPDCLLVPVSSWVVAVMSAMADKFKALNVGIEPMTAYIQTIPLNLYAWLALITVAIIALTDVEFGPMARHEYRAIATGDVGGMAPGKSDVRQVSASSKGTLWDLLVPILVLIVSTITMMAYTGGYFGGDTTFIDAIKNTDAAKSLMYAGFITLAVCLVMFLPRGIVAVPQLPEAAIGGFKSMWPAITILSMAWTIGGVMSKLETGVFLANQVGSSLPVTLYPAVLFAISCVIAFATGTSWGTFGIMVPIAIDFAHAVNPAFTIPMIAAVLSGSIYGDHCSPISDTTILSSIAAQCNHIDHVSTQLPYATTSAVAALIGFLVTGVVASVTSSYLAISGLSLAAAFVVLLVSLKVLHAVTQAQAPQVASDGSAQQV